MDLVNLYYDFIAGEYPENEEYYNRTSMLIEYLKDAGFKDNELTSLILNEMPNKDYLTVDDIPESAWNDSLLSKDVFYYHKELQVISPPSTWDEIKPFYLEMKIKYTVEDILNYFCSRCNVREEWLNKNKEIGSIKYLLESYSKFNFITPVDFLLHLIDYAASFEDTKYQSIYDICVHELECAEYLENDIKNAKLQKKNKVIWRTDACGI